MPGGQSRSSKGAAQRQDLAVRESAPVPAIPNGQPVDPVALGHTLAASGFFPDAKEAAQAAVKVMAGRELGFGAIASMTSIHIIRTEQTDNRTGEKVERVSVSIGGDLMAAKIKGSGRYRYQIVDYGDLRCEVAFFERDPSTGQWIHQPIGIEPDGTPKNVVFTIKDAARANLTNKFNWKSFPSKMLFWRCISIGADIVCPDLFSGSVATFDDVGLDVDGQGHLVTPADAADGQGALPTATTLKPPAQTQGPSGGGAQHSAPAATGTAQRSQATLSEAQQRKLWGDCGRAGIKDDEKLCRLLMMWVTGEEHSDRVPKAKANDLFAAIADHQAVLSEIVDRAKQGDQRARQLLNRFKPDLAPAPAAGDDVEGTARDLSDQDPGPEPGSQAELS